MALSFVFGGSGSGKSTYLYQMLTEQSRKNPDKQYICIVPDQFTMQVQKDLVTQNGSGIMNIDVLSFGRLTYRIFEETGGYSLPVLDDTGKNLILRLVAQQYREELKVLGSHLRKQGYIHEVKSAISEFKQYGISKADLDDVISFAEKRGALAQKLKDLQVLYGGFDAYIKDHYITTEESLDVLAMQIPKSKILKDSVIVFDGFTGFTPVQINVIKQLMLHAFSVTFSLTVDGKENPFLEDGEQKLFHLTKKTALGLVKAASELNVPRGEDVILGESPVKRFINQPALAHLEENLFRYPQKVYQGLPCGIHMAELLSPKAEAGFCAREVHRMVRTKGYLYRDIAVVCGNLEGYSTHIKSEFGKMGIPCYIDETRGILLNPFIELIRSGLNLKGQNFSVDSVNHFLRSGLCDYNTESIDELDNYIRGFGIRGYSMWKKSFVKAPYEGETGIQALETLNAVRKSFMETIEPLQDMPETASGKVRALYGFIEKAGIEEKLEAYEQRFTETGELVRAKEYHQIYHYIIDLLSQIDELLGEEILTEKEFIDLLDAGFSEMEVGTIPQSVDHVIIGDMERTRLKDVKVLFFLGVNDGNIPKNVSKGGIISDIDREFLQTSNWEFAPSPRQKMYIQRLYLYMNMTKPSEKLILTYACASSDGKTLRPAYLIDMMRKLYPDLTIQHPETEDEFGHLETWDDSFDYLAEKLREAAAGICSEDDLTNLAGLMALYTGTYKEKADTLVNAAFVRYQEVTLAKEIVRNLYGQNLINSITRLETFASCAYAHFLKYGLSLQERQEFGFEAVDLGNIFHGILAEFSEKLPEMGYTWFDFTPQQGEALLQELIEAYAAGYGNAVLYETARSQYFVKRIERILKRTIFTLQEQIKQGSFQPSHFEMSFQSMNDLDSISIALSQEETMHLVGRIDRLDTLEENNKCYVKIIDYKSGNTKFDLVALYHGLQLQLVTYLNAAVEYEKKEHPDQEIVPAGILYYHIDDPMIEAQVQTPPEEIEEEIIKALRVNGIVNADQEVIEKIDHTPGESLRVLPLSRKKDGSFKANSMLMEAEDLRTMSRFVSNKIVQLGKTMLSGKISADPYQRKDRSACTFCPYAKVCSFDPKIPGYHRRELEEYEQDIILEKMREEDGN